MMGQDAVKMAQGFEEKVGVDGVILTKLDGDARGGAALSITKVLGKPIYFVSEGEKPNQFSPFYPDRLASRILGMGDILSLAEKAQEVMDEEKARKLEEKLLKAEFTLEDFLEQMEAVEKMGPIKEMLKMLPGGLSKMDIPLDEKKIRRMKAIIQSMTVEERQNPAIIDGSRRRRIAGGSGTSPREVNELLKSFFEAKKLMKKMKKKGKMGLKQLFPF
jgi:signal recognition particle subunit SRP54